MEPSEIVPKDNDAPETTGVSFMYKFHPRQTTIMAVTYDGGVLVGADTRTSSVRIF